MKKYPRTPHLPLSPGATRDDRILKNMDSFIDIPVIITEKMDGSNLCLTKDDIFARSRNGKPRHKSFDWAKQFHSSNSYLLDEGSEYFFEYCYAVHSIKYKSVESYLYLIGVRNLNKPFDHWYSWEDTKDFANLLNVPTVPVIFDILPGQNIEQIAIELSKTMRDDQEGFVIRNKRSFDDESFNQNVAKFVRKNHVQTDKHWKYKQVEKQRINK